MALLSIAHRQICSGKIGILEPQNYKIWICIEGIYVKIILGATVSKLCEYFEEIKLSFFFFSNTSGRFHTSTLLDLLLFIEAINSNTKINYLPNSINDRALATWSQAWKCKNTERQLSTAKSNETNWTHPIERNASVLWQLLTSCSMWYCSVAGAHSPIQARARTYLQNTYRMRSSRPPGYRYSTSCKMFQKWFVFRMVNLCEAKTTQ